MYRLMSALPPKADVGVNLHVPLCFAPGITDTRSWQAVACLGTARRNPALTGSTAAIGWHIGLHCGCRRHPHCSENESRFFAKSKVWKGLPMAKVKYITSPDELPSGQNYVLVMYGEEYARTGRAAMSKADLLRCRVDISYGQIHAGRRLGPSHVTGQRSGRPPLISCSARTHCSDADKPEVNSHVS